MMCELVILADMPRYRRAWIPGGTYFFTVVTDRRRKLLADPVAHRLLGSDVGPAPAGRNSVEAFNPQSVVRHSRTYVALVLPHDVCVPDSWEPVHSPHRSRHHVRAEA